MFATPSNQSGIQQYDHHPISRTRPERAPDNPLRSGEPVLQSGPTAVPQNVGGRCWLDWTCSLGQAAVRRLWTGVFGGMFA